MQQSATITPSGGRPEHGTEDTIAVEAGDASQRVLDVLQDEDCQAILAATSDTARSAKELSTCCDLPLSTTYRKLEQLTEAELIAEQTRLRASGQHQSEYVRRVTDVTASFSDCGEIAVELVLEAPAESSQALQSPRA